MSLFNLFHQPELLKYHKRGNNSLVEFNFSEKKIGYLVCTHAENKIIIRTFLFLTNDGTPEGDKLAELTHLKLLDKKYLGIDSFAGLYSYRIKDNPALAQLFSEAGCGSLLELDDLRDYLKTEIKDRDPALLLKHLETIGYFGKEH